MGEGNGAETSSLGLRLRRRVFGAPRDVKDPGVFHKIALIPFFAWIGLGADGLSSSAYGPEEAFRNLSGHTYLAAFVGLATALTVFIISYTYSRIIERFPQGGGGYIVATKLLGEKAGLVSGCALVVDYILTIAVSVESCADALFSYCPPSWQAYKVPLAVVLICLLILLNIRGVKESITLLAPIFIVFLATHVLLLGYGLAIGAGASSAFVDNVHRGLSKDLGAIGFIGLSAIFLRAYSLGGGTFTGIEAVSNGMQILREPKVRNGKRTMAYMAGSLAITAGGLFVCYLFSGIGPQAGRTLNSTLADALYGSWGGTGKTVAFVTILSEGALLFVAAQAGFIDAPRVMANMAVDSWMPRRFADFSERLTMRNGILIIGGAAIAILVYTKGSISALVVMYSINVFLTFSLSEFAMTRHFIRMRKAEGIRLHSVAIQGAGFVLCVLILCLTIYEKFLDGGWLTVLITSVLIACCLGVRRHYRGVKAALVSLEALVPAAEAEPRRPAPRKKDPGAMTAIQLVSGYNGMGVHSFLQIQSSFPGLYRNFVFASVAVVNQELLKTGESVAELSNEVDASLKRYVELARRYGFWAEAHSAIGTNVQDAASELCRALAYDFPRSTVFSGNLIFSRDRFIYRLLHNESAFAIQRRLQWEGITNVVLPIRVR
jgi:amino acid transporter